MPKHSQVTMPSDSKIRDAAEFAQTEFWHTVADAFPQIKTGDFSPDADFEFTDACRKAVRRWVESNI